MPTTRNRPSTTGQPNSTSCASFITRSGLADMACANGEICLRGVQTLFLIVEGRATLRQFSSDRIRLRTPIANISAPFASRVSERLCSLCSVTSRIWLMMQAGSTHFAAAEKSPGPKSGAGESTLYSWVTRYGSRRPRASSVARPCTRTPCRTRRSSAPYPWCATRPSYAGPSSPKRAPTAPSGSGTTPVRRR